ncbi:MAG: nucleoside-diphosphate sugar epimerase/dehydratase [Candidatus Sumerlaeia bacterium]
MCAPGALFKQGWLGIAIEMAVTVQSLVRHNRHRLALAVLDSLMVALAFGLAFELRFDFGKFPSTEQYRQLFTTWVWVFIGVRIPLFWAFRLYKGILRYASVNELLMVGAATATGSVLLALLNMLAERLGPFGPFPVHSSGERLLRVPWGVLGTEFFLTLFLIGGERFSRRVVLTWARFYPRVARRALIVGTGDLGASIAHQMFNHPDRGFKPVAFVSVDPEAVGRQIHSTRVAGTLDDIASVIQDFDIDCVAIALERARPRQIQAVVEQCRREGVEVQIVPSAQDVLEGKVSVTSLRHVEIEDLLGRDEVREDIPPDRNYLRSEVVLVTGAGGSIGAELCRQILRYEPERLLLLGRGENSIYEIESELRLQHAARIVPIIADVRDEERIRRVFDRHRPTIVFHAAAHKHVPLMELQPDEAVKNNVLATAHLARLAGRTAVKRFVLISTDKAVRPTSVMGATKRLAEMVIFSLAPHTDTRFAAVRFGNVLGSRGSVIPLFKRQIERGGPVTVTHPDVQRYFMTIPEAVLLVLLSGTLAGQGQLFVLDMGDPVKIDDLARNLITLMGFTPGEDIEIVYTGLRPGEKLFEEILTDAEGMSKTEFGKIFIARPETIPWDEMTAYLDRLRDAAEDGDAARIRALLKERIPDYQPPDAGGGHAS